MALSLSASLGALFLILALITTYLMFHFWGYPYDDEKKRSSCPQWKMNIHRGFGYAYVVVYIIMMARMVPRLWTYQVEFPARTVAHICLGITIGVLLLVKVSIVRWFRHLEEMMPVLGICLLLCTVLLSGLSLPFAFKEQSLASAGAFGEENRARLLRILPDTKLGAEVSDLEFLVSDAGLREGRTVLLNKCTHCHDLRTIISRPRTPDDWHRVVQRMASKPGLGVTIEEADQQSVATYLVAITPDLQKSAKSLRKVDVAQESTLEALDQQAAAAVVEEDAGAPSGEAAVMDSGAAEKAFLSVCSQCHDVDEVEFEPPTDRAEVDSRVARMVKNGLEAPADQLQLVKAYLIETYVGKE